MGAAAPSTALGGSCAGAAAMRGEGSFEPSALLPPEELVEFLRRVPWFEGLSDADLLSIMASRAAAKAAAAKARAKATAKGKAKSKASGTGGR